MLSTNLMSCCTKHRCETQIPIEDYELPVFRDRTLVLNINRSFHYPSMMLNLHYLCYVIQQSFLVTSNHVNRHFATNRLNNT